MKRLFFTRLTGNRMLLVKAAADPDSNSAWRWQLKKRVVKYAQGEYRSAQT